jgi:alpha-beta hydrolase superfamily lysophospholipase
VEDAMKWLESERESARDFRLETSDRLITGALWLPENHSASTPLILCGHGASGDRYQAPIPHLAKRFLAIGAATLSLDGPVHGLRQVGPGGREALAEAFKRPELTDEMVSDWLGSLATVREVVGLENNPLAYFGLSMGTIFGIPTLAAAAAEDIPFRASVLGLAGTSGVVGFLGERLAKDAAAIEHPILFLMQLEDELFDRQGYLTLFDAIGSSDKRLHANPGLHPEIPSEEVDAAFAFLSARLTEDVPRDVTNPLAD